jgi:small conductance mechanosensitive channel
VGSLVPGLQNTSGLNELILRQVGLTDPGTIAVADLMLRLVEATLVLVATYFIARSLRVISRHWTENARWDLQLTLLVSRLVFLGAVILGVVAAISVISAGLAGVLLGAVGLLGLAFGLAFQDVLKNFLSGIFLLLERPFRIGDEIAVGEHAGKVETILLRVTVLKTGDGRKVLLPNQTVYNSAIVNVTGYPMRQFVSSVRLPEKADLDEVLGEAVEEVTKVAGVAQEPPPQVSLVPHLDVGTALEVRYWVKYREDDPAVVQREVNSRLLRVAGRGAKLEPV